MGGIDGHQAKYGNGKSFEKGFLMGKTLGKHIYIYTHTRA
jgi:hypothetical protein